MTVVELDDLAANVRDGLPGWRVLDLGQGVVLGMSSSDVWLSRCRSFR